MIATRGETNTAQHQIRIWGVGSNPLIYIMGNTYHEYHELSTALEGHESFFQIHSLLESPMQQSWGVKPGAKSGIQTNRQKNGRPTLESSFFLAGSIFWMLVANIYTLSDPLMTVCQQMYTATVRHKSLLENTGDFCGMRFYTSKLVTAFYMFYMFYALWQNVVSELSPSFSWCTFRICWVGTQDPAANWPFLPGWKPSIYEKGWFMTGLNGGNAMP